MANIKLASVITASSVQWSNGEPFNGSLLFLLATPELGAGNYPEVTIKGTSYYQQVRVPKRKIQRINEGVLDTRFRLPYSNAYSPPNCRYMDYWVDSTGVVVSGGNLREIEVEEYTIPPPTLTVPTQETDAPSVDWTISGAVVASVSALSPIYEDLSGQVDGVQTVFTMSATPTYLEVFYQGMKLKPVTDYSFSGTTLTMVEAPLTGRYFSVVRFQ